MPGSVTIAEENAIADLLCDYRSLELLPVLPLSGLTKCSSRILFNLELLVLRGIVLHEKGSAQAQKRRCGVLHVHISVSSTGRMTLQSRNMCSCREFEPLRTFRSLFLPEKISVSGQVTARCHK